MCTSQMIWQQSTPTLLLAFVMCYLWKIVPSVAYMLPKTLYSIQTLFVTKSKYAGRLFPPNHLYVYHLMTVNWENRGTNHD